MPETAPVVGGFGDDMIKMAENKVNEVLLGQDPTIPVELDAEQQNLA
jgi:hypothetical protein